MVNLTTGLVYRRYRRADPPYEREESQCRQQRERPQRHSTAAGEVLWSGAVQCSQCWSQSVESGAAGLTCGFECEVSARQSDGTQVAVFEHCSAYDASTFTVRRLQTAVSHRRTDTESSQRLGDTRDPRAQLMDNGTRACESGRDSATAVTSSADNLTDESSAATAAVEGAEQSARPEWKQRRRLVVDLFTCNERKQNEAQSRLSSLTTVLRTADVSVQ